MIRHTAAPPYISRYSTTITASATVTVETIEFAPNSALCLCCKVDNNATLRIVNQTTDATPVTYETTDYAVTSAAPVCVYHRGGAGAAKVQLIAGGADVVPDLRIFPMSQPT